MKKYIYKTFLFVFCISSVYAQNESINQLVEQSNKMDLDRFKLVDFANSNLNKKEDLSRFFYYWIGSNIRYDHIIFDKMIANEISDSEFGAAQKAEVVYKNRKGVCAGYANLFKWFMDQIDVEAVVISGYIRDQRNHYLELDLDDDFRHGWNAIKLNGKWMLVDSTWGTSSDSAVSDFYFDVKPEFFIITHFPEDPKWQLLDNPLSVEQFNNSMFIEPIWFMLGFTDIPKLLADNEFYYFRFKKEEQNIWSVGINYSVDNINFSFIPDIKVVEQDGYVYYKFSKTNMPKVIYFKIKLSKYESRDGNLQEFYYDDVINFKI